MHHHQEHHEDHDGHDHDRGLNHDLATLAQQARRRQTLRWLAGLGAAGTLPLWGCGGGGEADAASTTTTSTTTTGTSTTTGTTTTTTGTTTTANSGSCSAVPEETAGPYPGDGSNTANGSVANALALSGIVRSDIRSSIAGASGVAGGVPLMLTLTLANSNSSSCASLAGYAIYLWHCDREGRYSMYTSGVTAENYLRGVQQTGGSGSVLFQTIVPGCYAGRMPHMHFEVYRSTATATNAANKLRTSQIAFPRDVCATVYASASGYSASVANLNAISFATDNVFSDGVSLQTASMSGSVAAGYTASLTVAIAV